MLIILKFAVLSTRPLNARSLVQERCQMRPGTARHNLLLSAYFMRINTSTQYNALAKAPFSQTREFLSVLPVGPVSPKRLDTAHPGAPELSIFIPKCYTFNFHAVDN